MYVYKTIYSTYKDSNLNGVMELCNRGDNAPNRHLRPSSKMSTAKNGLHLVDLLAKGVSQTPLPPKNSQAIAKAISYSSQP